MVKKKVWTRRYLKISKNVFDGWKHLKRRLDKLQRTAYQSKRDKFDKASFSLIQLRSDMLKTDPSHKE